MALTMTIKNMFIKLISDERFGHYEFSNFQHATQYKFNTKYLIHSRVSKYIRYFGIGGAIPGGLLPRTMQNEPNICIYNSFLLHKFRVRKLAMLSS